MKYIFILLIFFLAPYYMLAQKAPTWKYSVSWRVSDLVKKEISIDYDFLKTEEQIFSISCGFKWHSLDENLRYEGIKTNFFVATNKFHHNYIKMNSTALTASSPIIKNTEYYNNTKSLTRYGTFAPELSIPIGFSYLRKFGPGIKRMQVWIKTESILFFHKGYQYSSNAIAIQDYGFSNDNFAQIWKYQENVTAQKKVEANLYFALGVLIRIRIFDRYFIGLNSKAQFSPSNRYNPSSYHGLRRANGRFVISLGKYLNQSNHQEQAPNVTVLE